jgi:hypothetical protein
MSNNKLEVSKKIKKSIKSKKSKKPNHEKNPVKLIRIFKKTIGSIWFGSVPVL